MKKETKTPAARGNEANADHHLWNNNGTWWCHFTLHLPDFTKRRMRVGLKTRVAAEARERRDGLLRLFGPLVAANGSASSAGERFAT